MKDERVLLLAAGVRVVLGNENGELAPGEHDLLDLGPVEEADLVVTERYGLVGGVRAMWLRRCGALFEHEDARGREAELVLVLVAAVDGVHVYAVHLEPFGLVEEGEFGLGGRAAPVGALCVAELCVDLGKRTAAFKRAFVCYSTLYRNYQNKGALVVLRTHVGLNLNTRIH